MTRVSTIIQAAVIGTALAASSHRARAQVYSNNGTVYTVTQDTGGDIPLASKHFTWPDLPEKADSGDGPRGTQQGYNICNSTTQNQDSFCQTGFLNAADDFCLWGSPVTNETVADVEEEMVAYCTKKKYGTRLLSEGAITGLQFIKTPDYVEVVGFIDQTALNLTIDDFGGEEDPHGADQRGNPLGSLMYSSAFSRNGSSPYTQVLEWSYFVGSGVFCFKACDPAGPRAAQLCQHTYDRVGCAYNCPANYAAINGTFQSCLGDDQLPVGTYVSNGVTSTWSQPPESLGPITSIPYTAAIPATSSCTMLSSAAIFTELFTSPTSTSSSSSSSASSTGSSGSSGASSSRSGSGGSSPSATGSSSSSSSTSSSSAAPLDGPVSRAGVVFTVFVAAGVSLGLAMNPLELGAGFYKLAAVTRGGEPAAAASSAEAGSGIDATASQTDDGTTIAAFTTTTASPATTRTRTRATVDRGGEPTGPASLAEAGSGAETAPTATANLATAYAPQAAATTARVATTSYDDGQYTPWTSSWTTTSPSSVSSFSTPSHSSVSDDAPTSLSILRPSSSAPASATGASNNSSSTTSSSHGGSLLWLYILLALAGLVAFAGVVTVLRRRRRDRRSGVRDSMDSRSRFLGGGGGGGPEEGFWAGGRYGGAGERQTLYGSDGDNLTINATRYENPEMADVYAGRRSYYGEGGAGTTYEEQMEGGERGWSWGTNNYNPAQATATVLASTGARRYRAKTDSAPRYAREPHAAYDGERYEGTKESDDYLDSLLAASRTGMTADEHAAEQDRLATAAAYGGAAVTQAFNKIRSSLSSRGSRASRSSGRRGVWNPPMEEATDLGYYAGGTPGRTRSFFGNRVASGRDAAERGQYLDSSPEKSSPEKLDYALPEVPRLAYDAFSSPQKKTFDTRHVDRDEDDTISIHNPARNVRDWALGAQAQPPISYSAAVQQTPTKASPAKAARQPPSPPPRGPLPTPPKSLEGPASVTMSPVVKPDLFFKATSPMPTARRERKDSIDPATTKALTDSFSLSSIAHMVFPDTTPVVTAAPLASSTSRRQTEPQPATTSTYTALPPSPRRGAGGGQRLPTTTQHTVLSPNRSALAHVASPARRGIQLTTPRPLATSPPQPASYPHQSFVQPPPVATEPEIPSNRQSMYADASEEDVASPVVDDSVFKGIEGIQPGQVFRRSLIEHSPGQIYAGLGGDDAGDGPNPPLSRSMPASTSQGSLVRTAFGVGAKEAEDRVRRQRIVDAMATPRSSADTWTRRQW